MKQALSLLIAATFAGCSCDCGKVEYGALLIGPDGYEFALQVETPCGTELIPVDEYTYATTPIGKEYCK